MPLRNSPMKITDMLSVLIILFLLPYLSIGADASGDDILTITITITTDWLNPIVGTVPTTYTTTILTRISIGPSATQSSSISSSTTFERLRSSTTLSPAISATITPDSTTTSIPTSIITDYTAAPSPTSRTTSIPPILTGGNLGGSGDSTKSITNAAIIGISTGLGVAFALAGVAFWINRRQRKAQAKEALTTAHVTSGCMSGTIGSESIADRRWHGQLGPSDGHWVGRKETEAQITPITGRGIAFQNLDSVAKGPYSGMNMSDEGYWTNSQRLRSFLRSRASRSTLQTGPETPSLNGSENLRTQTDIAMRDVELELETLSRSMAARGYRLEEDLATTERRISPEDLAIQKFNELHAAYQLHPLTSHDKPLPALPNEEPVTAPQAISSHNIYSNEGSRAETKPTIDVRTAKNRTQALETLEGRRYAPSSVYSQDSAGDAPASGDGQKTWKNLPNLRERYR